MKSSWQIVRLAVSAAGSALLRKRVLNCLWEVTYRCNARCGICPHWRKAGRVGEELTTEEIRTGLACLARHGLRAVNFTGGEPLLREDLAEVVDAASRRGIWTSVVTNGSLCTRERLGALKAAGLDNLLVSLDSHSPAVHDEHRGIPGLFDKVRAVLDWMSGEFLTGYRTGGIMCTIARHNTAGVGEMIELARRHGVYLVLQPYHTNKTGDASLAAALSNEAAGLIRTERRRGGVLLNSERYLAGLLRFQAGELASGCAAGKKYFSVDPYGYLHACVDMPAAGHLLRDGFAGLGRADQVATSQCPGCWYCFRGEADCTLSLPGYLDKLGLACRVVRENRARGEGTIRVAARIGANL